ncbi:MAG: Uncharacterised protein [Formosa sp. Hel1_33_131]|jgi:hypothetical protein|nr:MAG: Uncharacterised protein [Formosa sp. Hel1_33_131]|tara:strand:- start:122 stop:1576 length:1455 start_codon:yes stop_codon:yes gene_type:complete
MVITLKIDSNVKKSGLNSVYFYVSQGKSGSISQMRKKIYVGLDVSIKQFDLKNFRAKSRHANFQIINKRLDELRVLMSTSQTKFEASQYTVEQVILHLKGEADAESVDSYIETFVKSQKSKKTTYTDYKYTLSAFKKHIGYNKERPITFNEFSNYSLLLKFKNNAQANGVRATSINSYFKKIKAIINDAYDNQVVFERFEFRKRLTIQNAERKEIKTLTTEEFKKATNTCVSIYEVQALCFYLLMFMTRGMYQADLVKFKSYNLKNDTDNKKEDEYSKFCQDGYDYIVHTRSKNQNRSNNKMLIRIDDTTMIMFKLLKQSVWCTHYDRRKELKLEEDDLLNVFGYDVDDVKLHTGVFDVYQKHCKKLLGVPLKNARKSFNSYAFRLEISQEIRNVLLGHTNPNIIKHYDDLSFIEEQVNAAHISVLKKFEVKTLVNLLEKQFHKVGADFIESESIILDLEKFGKHNSKFINKHNSSAYVKRVRG